MFRNFIRRVKISNWPLLNFLLGFYSKIYMHVSKIKSSKSQHPLFLRRSCSFFAHLMQSDFWSAGREHHSLAAILTTSVMRLSGFSQYILRQKIINGFWERGRRVFFFSLLWEHLQLESFFLDFDSGAFLSGMAFFSSFRPEKNPQLVKYGSVLGNLLNENLN